MGGSAVYLSASAAARQCGVSVKALRLYEQRGLVLPMRSEAGWRVYGPGEMARIGEIVALRALGLTLSQVERLPRGDDGGLAMMLRAHQASLEDRLGQLAAIVDRVRGLRNDLAQGKASSITDVVQPEIAFDLPWPWGGERFELRDIRTVNYIIGSLGSGKTRLAQTLAQIMPGGSFLGLDRLEAGGAAARAMLARDPALKASVDRVVGWLLEEGAKPSGALTALLAGIIGAKGEVVVVDMVEEGLDQETQTALAAYLRLGAMGKTLFLLTRSSAILDLAMIGPNEGVILCPANHSVPRRVLPYHGAVGYESVANCLATPQVRARIAARPVPA
ncbi:MerR family transcriptional regulator [uncultured Devosia sp.]|uniref:MerR family transcriptional regulator n=1 Tax=uncultured Devosia sp. TaxID=211434 RepID=UPI0035CB5604